MSRWFVRRDGRPATLIFSKSAYLGTVFGYSDFDEP
jgi:hypothetical protein